MAERTLPNFPHNLESVVYYNGLGHGHSDYNLYYNVVYK